MTATWGAVAAVVLVLLLRPPRPLRVPRVPRLEIGRPRRSGRGDRAELAWVDAVVEELRAGRDPADAARVASSDHPVCPTAAVAASSGEDVAAALDADARSDLLRGVAATWRVAQSTGAGLAAGLASLADAAREAEAVRAELRVGVAEPRATAVVLSLLPAAGLALGWLLGAEPLGWLLGTAPGRAVLAAGVLLDLVGVAWAWRIVRVLEASV